MGIDLQYSAGISPSDPKKEGCLVIGQLENLNKISYSSLECKLAPVISESLFKTAVASLSPSPTDVTSIWGKQVVLVALPSKASRHNAPMFPHALTSLVKASVPAMGKDFIVIVCEKNSAFALGAAVARAFPLFNQKSNAGRKERIVVVEFLLVDTGEKITEADVACLRAVAESVRLTASIVDKPCNLMNTDHFLEEIRAVEKDLKGLVSLKVVRGEELDANGFGGIYGVGKAAEHPPALAVLSYTPPDAKVTIAWVGKGIVFDTGGLSIKDKVHMPGMKRDCGGAAAVLGAFRAAVMLGFKENLHAVFCLAENAVSSKSTRPDDILTLYSGLTVEVNNTDAEGRLVLGDGVAYACKDLQASIIVDMATLTGAQGISTGTHHAAIVTNDETWERACCVAGRISGDLVHPLPFCPDIHFSEFNSAVADMKNSVKDRSNAQSSCAGLFIFSHIGFNYPGVWLHIDMASPVHLRERATGYGVALLVTLFGNESNNKMLQSIAPNFP